MLANRIIGLARGNEDTFDVDSTSQYTHHDQSPASWTIASGQLTASGGSNSKFIRNGTSYADVLIETDMTQAGDGGLVLRFLNANNFYQLAVYDDSSNSSVGAAIYKCLNGSFTLISGQPNFPWPRGTPKRFGFRASGTTLTAYVDGVQILQVTDTSIAGRVALACGCGIPPPAIRFISHSAGMSDDRHSRHRQHRVGRRQVA
jgi:hypothetical protein